MKILVFGNEIVKKDSLAVKLIPDLKKVFPKITFVHFDAVENLPYDDKLTILDVVEGLKEPRLIKLEELKNSQVYSMHDFDLGYNLLLLKKIGKIKDAVIIGIPSSGEKKEILKSTIEIISSLFSKSA